MKKKFDTSEETVNALATTYAKRIVDKGFEHIEYAIRNAFKKGFTERNDEVSDLSTRVSIMTDMLLRIMPNEDLKEFIDTYWQERSFSETINELDSQLAEINKRKSAITKRLGKSVRKRNDLSEFHRAKIAHKLSQYKLL